MLLEEVAATAQQHGISLLAPMFILDMASLGGFWFCASEFGHLFEAGPAELAYAGTPVSGLTQHEQGRRCQEWARKVLQEQNPVTQMFPPPPLSCHKRD